MLLAAVGTVVGVLVVLAQPAWGVTNPGAFATTVQAGSSLTLASGAVFGIGTPACADGSDNDTDTLIDAADPECDATNDNNERVNGVQAYVQPRVNTTINAAGTINLAVAGYVFPASEICVNILGVQCLNATIAGDGATVGNINPEGPTPAAGDGTITLPVDLRVELDAVTGFIGLPGNCRILPATATLTSNNYNKTNGNATLANAVAVSVPAVTSCGIYNALINGALGLPTTAVATLITQTRNAGGLPVLP
jgi:hypothetical protein